MAAMPRAALTERDDQPTSERIIVLKGAGWGDYQRLLEIRGEKAAPRLRLQQSTP